jgi:hypothetical protein
MITTVWLLTDIDLYEDGSPEISHTAFYSREVAVKHFNEMAGRMQCSPTITGTNMKAEFGSRIIELMPVSVQ